MKRIQKQALAHYDRMIEWAETQLQKNRPDINIMFDEIKEKWTEDYCSYCKKMELYACSYGCNLHTSNRGHCCNGFWYKMNYAATWKTWIKYAKKVREYIEVHG